MDEKEFDYINVVPLVDVMLVLLTIILTTSTFIARKSLPLALPRADGSSESENRNDVIIEIDRHGVVYIDSEHISIDELRVNIKQKERDLHILVKADKSVELQKFVEILDLVKNEGFRSVSLQTEMRR